ncbi:MAG: translation elongation factor Ts [Planctomycetota bacterium]
MAISAKMVRDLREQTGAPMMDCKKALEATSGDFEGAIDHLRKSGLKKAEKKAGRSTSEGRVLAHVGEGGHVGAMVSVECETDFVANTDDFQNMMKSLCEHVAAQSPANAEEMVGQSWKDGGTVGDFVKAMVGKLGENIRVADAVRMENSNGRVAAYIHHDHKQAVLLNVTTGADANTADEFIKGVGMHVAALKPAALSAEEIPADVVEREKAIFKEQVANKPAEMQDKIVEGMMKKFFAENTLLSQPYVRDDSKTVQKALEDTLGAGSKLEAFSLFRIG